MTRSTLSQKGQTIILVIILILVLGSVMMVGGFSKLKQPTGGIVVNGIIVTGSPGQGQKNLQMQSFNFITVVPTKPPTSVCQSDTGTPVVNTGVPVTDALTCNCPGWLAECKAGKCIRTFPEKSGKAGGCEVIPWCDDRQLAPRDGIYCLEKPVIYLYPEKTTLVDVRVETPGKIVVSDPLYPTGGWKDVEAHPDGTLIYEGKKYSELFYESEVTNFLKPTNGIIIPVSNIDLLLASILHRLGLNEWESNEFSEFWVPKLKNLNSPYVLFSIIEEGVKEKVDRVIITPEPDTKIEFIAYFKPLYILASIKPLILPERPARRGFTYVEWGGTIDRGSSLSTLR